MSGELRVPQELHDALARVRADDSAEDFVVAGFDDVDSLKVLGTGSNGVAGIKALLPSADVCYALLRRKFTWEKAGQVSADTTKFIFVLWRPEAIPLKRKMTIGRYDGQVKKLFSSYHSDLDINDEDELSEEIVDALIAKITQTADRSTQRRSLGMYMGGAKLGWNKTKDKLKPDSRAEFKVVAGAKLKWAEGADVALAAALKDVRDDTSATRWCLATYHDKDVLGFTGAGEGDVSEMLGHCTDSAVSYGLFRLTERVDRTDATRFCFVVYTPENVPPMAKAIIATHKGAVTPIFRPFHQDFHISDPEELTEEIALDKISGLSGSRSHVTERVQQKKKSVFARKFLGGVKGETQPLVFEDEEALRAAIADVRNDDTATNWVAAAFTGLRKDITLSLAGSGGGGVEEMADVFKPDRIMFALLRSEAEVDENTVVRFYLFKWQGEDVSMTTAGNAGVFAGAVSAVFAPFTDDVIGTTVEEILDAARSKGVM